ncbi:MAG TPA: class I SAM-dependent methyltransferase [Blastocatellia bacterium]
MQRGQINVAALSWDSTWESTFRKREWGKYPPEELIRFAARNLRDKPDRKKIKVLELGCGPGANLWFFAREGFDVYGIDGSETAISQASQYLDEGRLKANLRVGDVVNLAGFYPGVVFDAVADVACLQHNRIEAIRDTVSQANCLLKPGGKLFSMMVAAGSYGEALGTQVAPGTYVDIVDGPLKDAGLSHLSTLEEILDIFGCFAEVSIEYTIRSLDRGQHEYKHWVIDASKSL